MDLFSIAGTFWRHKIVTIPVVLLTLLGAFYVLKVKAPTYKATSSFLLSNPPGPPTAPEIAANPKLGKINPNNPYANYGTLSIAAAVLVNLVSTPAVQQALVQAGADPRYQITPNTEFGLTAPIIQITGIGSTAQEAIRSADLVTAKAESELYQMQVSQGVNTRYLIKALQLTPPQQATLSASSKLRTLIAVLGLGAILLFVAISIADAIDRRRRDRVRNTKTSRGARSEGTGHDPHPQEGGTAWKMRPTFNRSAQRSVRR